MAQPKWRIYYGDGSTFSDLEGTPKEAPPLNVQVIVMHDPENGRRIIHLWDWYYWVGDEWYGSDLVGALDQFLHRDVEALKQGRNVKNEVYKEILKKAHNDPDFLEQTAKNPKESPGQIWGEGKNEN